MIRCVLFDLDGTLIDTNDLIIESFMHVLNEKLSLGIAREEIISQMGMPLVEQFRHFTGRDDVGDLVAAYQTYNLRRHDEMVRIFPHVNEVVEALAEAGIATGVVTNKMRGTTMRALEMFGLKPLMKTIVTLDDVSRGKPHPEPVQKGMEAVGAKPEETVMVGDSPYDIESARRAGARSAGVAWSLKGENVLQMWRPDWMLRDLRELYAIVGLKRE
jgi:pyrophosphatase PpaX